MKVCSTYLDSEQVRKKKVDMANVVWQHWKRGTSAKITSPYFSETQLHPDMEQHGYSHA